jgi:hypothetical protein
MATNQDARDEQVRARLATVAIPVEDETGFTVGLSDSGLDALVPAVLALLDEARPTLDVEALRANLHATFNGGWHHSDDGMQAFHHGMDTVCNVLADKQKGGNANRVWPLPPSSPGRPDKE